MGIILVNGRHPAVNKAVEHLGLSHHNIEFNELYKLFSETYQCKFYHWGIRIGDQLTELRFDSPEAETFFMLKWT
jgi:hypothetical protein